ncbi:hypothetical protein KJ359_005832 [Pestalotiopsis sp. 9143b]|nr:hypothetical protein KJ359_005832 [Pestalotiopsis sp. 9143b]
MKRARIASRLLASAPRAVRISRTTHQLPLCTKRHASTTAEHSETSEQTFEDVIQQQSGATGSQRRVSLPSPPPSKAKSSAKLAALHARLSLSPKIPVETLARALIDASADAHPKFNNANLAYIGSSLLHNHASEHLITRYPRLPMAILFSAMKGYVGPAVLHQVARAWGVESAAAPGEEVDPGLLQYDPHKPTTLVNRWGNVRAESAEIQRFKWRRGMSSRVMYDDAFGEMVPGQKSVTDKTGQYVADNERNTKDMVLNDYPQNAHANFVRALVGAVYLHCGRETAKNFVKSHFLLRKLDLANLFEFKLPTRELVRLCAREDFEPPVARLESETGRLSRTPVYVVGIYSGNDKLGEGAGSDLDSARVAAAINALKAWYLYSPGEVGVPSDTLAEDAEPWKPAYVDIGEIIS